MSDKFPKFHEAFYDFNEVSKSGMVRINEEDVIDSTLLSYEFEKGEKIYIYDLLNAYTHELRKYFKMKNPFEWNRWKGNACRQIAVFTAPIIKYLFQDSIVEVKDIIFKNNSKKIQYNHSFVVAKNNNGTLYLFDLERQPVNADVIALIKTDDDNFPHRGLYSYEGEKFVGISSIISNQDLNESISETKEFYTREIGKKVILNCLKSVKITFQRDEFIKDKINEIINYVEKEY